MGDDPKAVPHVTCSARAEPGWWAPGSGPLSGVLHRSPFVAGAHEPLTARRTTATRWLAAIRLHGPICAPDVPARRKDDMDTNLTEVDGPLLAVARQLLDITDEMGWDQPARLALLNDATDLPEGEFACAVGDDSGLVMGWPTVIEGHPCPALAEIGAQHDSIGAVLITEGWIDAASVAAIPELSEGCAGHVAVDGRLEVRTAIGVHRDGTRVQVSRPRGGTTTTATGTAGRVPDALAMTIGIDADADGVNLADILRRAWLSIASIDAARQLGANPGGIHSVDEAFGQLRDRVADTRLDQLDDDLASSPFTRLARLVARSIDDTEATATWKRLTRRLRTETSDDQPMIGWALSAGVDPGVLCHWTATSERRARRWAGPGMLARIIDGGYATWDDLDIVMGEIHPRTRTYLQLLPALDDIIADLAGNPRQA